MPMDASSFPSKSSLITETLEAQLITLLGKIVSKVELTCILDDGDKSTEMAAFVNHICALSPQLNCVFLAPGDNPALDKLMDSNLLPATGVSAPSIAPRMVFHGIPGGKEINAFASALLVAGGAGKELDKYTIKDITKLKKPLELQICVSLGCQHCAQLVSHAQRIAWENPMVTSHMIDANLYPELVKDYGIQRVPLTVVNRKKSFPGGKTMAELLTLLLKA